MFQRGEQGIAVMLHVLFSWVFLKKPLPDFWHCTALTQSCPALRWYLNAALSVSKSDCASALTQADLVMIWLIMFIHSGSFVFPFWVQTIPDVSGPCFQGFLGHGDDKFCIYFEYKARSWTFQNWLWEGRVSVTQVTKLGNVAQEELKAIFCPKHIYVTPAATKQDSLMGMRGSGQPNFSRWSSL